MDEQQTLDSLDHAIAVIRQLQGHSMVAAHEKLFVAAENLLMLRRSFHDSHREPLAIHRCPHEEVDMYDLDGDQYRTCAACATTWRNGDLWTRNQ